MKFNWPTVLFLLFLAGLPGLPAIFIVGSVLLSGVLPGEMVAWLNVEYINKPAAIVTHGLSGILFFLLMPFQFSPKLRANKRQWHKHAGRIAVVSGYLLGLSGIWLHWVLQPGDLSASFWSVVILAAAMCICFTLALKAIFSRRIAIHERWMIRAVAATLGAVTPLFVDIVLYLTLSSAPALLSLAADVMHGYGQVIGLVINLCIVELWFKMKQAKGLPQTTTMSAS